MSGHTNAVTVKRWPLALIALAAVGLAIRLLISARGAGLDSGHHYDPSVYYAAAASLLHGRTPYVYDQFVLLHPPGLMLVLLPAALVGHVAGDRVGFLTANVEVATIGALNAVLVALLAARVGLPRRGAVAGGLLYAVWLASWNGETAARLEPVGNAVLLLGLLALAAAVERGLATPAGRHRLLAAGALLGGAANVKIWYAVPVVLVAGWLLVCHRSVRAAVTLAAGLVAVFVVVDLPFLVASRGEMWSMVVTAQLGRYPVDVPLLRRWVQLMGVVPRTVATHRVPVEAAGVLVFAVVVAVAVLAWRRPAARLYVVLAVAHVAVLLAAPAWAPEYAGFAAVPLCLCVAAAAAALPGRRNALAWLPVGAAAAVTLTVLVTGSLRVTTSWGNVAPLQAVVRTVRCVQSDSPDGLIALDALDRDLSRGCQVWIDVTGRTYLGADHGPPPRRDNARWQQSLVRHLRCGDAAYLSLFGHQLTPRTVAAVARDGVLGRTADPGGRVVYRIARPEPGCR